MLDSWLRLRPRAGRPGPTRHVLWLWSLPLLLAPPLFSRDAYSYAGQGRLVHVGIDPYRYGPAAIAEQYSQNVDPMWLYTPAPYGPLQLQIQHLIVDIAGPSNPYAAAVAMRLPALLGVALIAFLLPKIAQPVRLRHRHDDLVRRAQPARRHAPRRRRPQRRADARPDGPRHLPRRREAALAGRDRHRGRRRDQGARPRGDPHRRGPGGPPSTRPGADRRRGVPRAGPRRWRLCGRLPRHHRRLRSRSGVARGTGRAGRRAIGPVSRSPSSAWASSTC